MWQSRNQKMIHYFQSISQMEIWRAFVFFPKKWSFVETVAAALLGIFLWQLCMCAYWTNLLSIIPFIISQFSPTGWIGKPLVFKYRFRSVLWLDHSTREIFFALNPGCQSEHSHEGRVRFTLDVSLLWRHCLNPSKCVFVFTLVRFLDPSETCTD